MEIRRALNNVVFQMPRGVTIMGRTSTLTNSFVNGIIPPVQPSEDEIAKCLSVLGLDPADLRCAYCGDKYSEWDHLNPIVRNKKPTGYISEIANLVPSCGKCNQSKGGKHWKAWMLGNAPNSPKSRRIRDLDDRVRRLEEFEKLFKATVVDFEELVGAAMWGEYWDYCEKLRRLMKESQGMQDKVRQTVLDRIGADAIAGYVNT